MPVFGPSHTLYSPWDHTTGIGNTVDHGYSWFLLSRSGAFDERNSINPRDHDKWLLVPLVVRLIHGSAINLTLVWNHGHACFHQPHFPSRALKY